MGHPQLPLQLADIMHHPHLKLTMHVPPTPQTHHACTTHNPNSPCMHHTHLKLTLHAPPTP